MNVAVLGAGLQGVCVAFALSEQGHDVTVIDRADAVMVGASLRNEGKIHLGLTYANDPSLKTAMLMLDSALAFAPLLDRWCDGLPWEQLRSRAFTYLVMRDSILDPAAVVEHFERIDEAYRTVRSPDTSYLGTAPSSLLAGRSAPPYVEPSRVSTGISTVEMAVDLDGLRSQLVAVLASRDRISVDLGCEVTRVDDGEHGFVVHFLRSGEPRHRDFDAVVNCLWDGRLAIDRDHLELSPDPWVYRLKYRVLAQLPPTLLGELPALTMVLGPFGDVVPMHRASYLSWYPAVLKGWSTDVSPPREWRAPCAGQVDAATAATVAKEVLGALDQIVPGIGRSDVTAVDAGIVFAWGSTDIDRPDSRFHERSSVGVTGGDGYFSIDTGKLTCAPLFATHLAESFA